MIIAVDACLSFKSALIPTKTDREQKKANAARAKDNAMMLSLQTQEEKDKTTEDVCDMILAQALKSLL